MCTKAILSLWVMMSGYDLLMRVRLTPPPGTLLKMVVSKLVKGASSCFNQDKDFFFIGR